MDLVLFDPFQTKAVPTEDGKTLVEVATWFDNETSYISHFRVNGQKVLPFPEISPDRRA